VLALAIRLLDQQHLVLALAIRHQDQLQMPETILTQRVLPGASGQSRVCLQPFRKESEITSLSYSQGCHKT
jgi:hypothetical protein